MWGSSGSDPGELATPYGVGVDQSNREVYLADTGNNRVQKFRSTGAFILEWGSEGNQDDQFNSPMAVAIDGANSRVYVADMLNNQIKVFNTVGHFVSKWTMGNQ